MRRSVPRLLLPALFLGSTFTSAFADCGLDAQQSDAGNSWVLLKNGEQAAQSFEISTTGTLDSVHIHISGIRDTVNTILVGEIRALVSGEPGTTVLATDTLTADGLTLPGIAKFEFDSPPSVTANDVIVFLLESQSASNPAWWTKWAGSRDSYPDGVAFSRGDSTEAWRTHSGIDRHFKAFVCD